MESQHAFMYPEQVLWICGFILGGLAFSLGPIAIVYLFMPSGRTRNLTNRTKQHIECGMTPIGDSWIRYNVVFYLYALIFLAFDVDVLFLFPVVQAFDDPTLAGGRDFIEIVLFVGILALAIIYPWIKGVFKWEKKIYLNR